VAVSHNAGDAPSWVNLAILCEADGDAECQARATERAVATAGFFEAELLNSALSYESLGMPDAADDAYRRSLLSQRLTAFVSDWPRDVTIGDVTLEEDFGALLEFNRLLAWWAMGEPIDAASIADPATRALAHAMRDERAEAERWLERAIDVAPDSIVTWDVAVIVRDHWGLPVDRELAIAGVVRGQEFPERVTILRLRSQMFDIATFRTYPSDGLVRGAKRVGTSQPYPWILRRALP
jgi:tetratricopeptide (TPR) repeat protein